MVYSIYHFFKHLVNNRHEFYGVEKLELFPFDDNMLACKNIGQFPDLAIRLNVNNPLFTGGELIELKDSKSYSVSSFNSTIPTGQKGIETIIKGINSSIKKQMKDAGNHIFSLPYRDVYYLIRGKHGDDIKIVLVHGSFFETVKSDNLINESFKQVLEENLAKHNTNLDEKTKLLLVGMFSEQESFSKVRNVDKAAVKLRFRIMTEVKAEGNILNTKQYPEIKNNTVNLIIPYHSEKEKEMDLKRFQNVFGKSEFKKCERFSLKHHLDGYFTVFQVDL